jgi:hypothetical protein
MEMFGLDLTSILVTAGFVAFWGAVLIGFVIYYDKNPYVPRKYYKVKVYNKDGQLRKECKGWVVTTNKVKWFRIGLVGFPGFKGVEKDVSVMETINSRGEIDMIENIPDRIDETNYTPKNVPITQKDAFVTEVVNSILPENRPTFELKLRETMAKHSRVVDLNTSYATKQYIVQARREAERVKSDDFIYNPQSGYRLFVCLSDN